MIYTITMNPSIDCYMNVEKDLMENEVNRSTSEVIKAGGKGINVSMILDKYEIQSTALVLLGGFTGCFIQEEIQKNANIRLISIPIEGINRINMKVHHRNKALCINGKGPKANEKTMDTIFNSISYLNEKDWVLVCGSLLQGIGEEFILKLAELVDQRKAKLVIDMESISLELLRKCHPYLIKPNLYEFEILMKQKFIGIEDLIRGLKECIQIGPQNVLVSLGADGAVLATSNQIYRMTQKTINAVNKVGSGDAMLASFVGKLAKGGTFQEALIWGGAAGSATASTLDDITYEMIADYVRDVKVEII